MGPPRLQPQLRKPADTRALPLTGQGADSAPLHPLRFALAAAGEGGGMRWLRDSTAVPRVMGQAGRL